MEGKAKMHVFWSKAEGHKGSFKASAGGCVMSNEPNCPHYGAKNGGRQGNEANCARLVGGGTVR